MAWSCRAVYGELVPGQVTHVGGVAWPGGQARDDGQPLGQDHHDKRARSREESEWGGVKCDLTSVFTCKIYYCCVDILLNNDVSH